MLLTNHSFAGHPIRKRAKDMPVRKGPKDYDDPDRTLSIPAPNVIP